MEINTKLKKKEKKNGNHNQSKINVKQYIFVEQTGS